MANRWRRIYSTTASRRPDHELDAHDHAQLDEALKLVQQDLVAEAVA
jgi:hypothetical protein